MEKSPLLRVCYVGSCNAFSGTVPPVCHIDEVEFHFANPDASVWNPLGYAPDVWVLDGRYGCLSRMMEQVATLSGDAKWVLAVDRPDDAFLLKALHQNVHGLIEPPDSLNDLTWAVRRIREVGIVFSPSIQRQLAQLIHAQLPLLKPRIVPRRKR